jgi:L-aspartate oxidase
MKQVKTPIQPVDLIIVGAGLAGLTVALNLAPYGQVIVIAKSDFGETATAWAQGGIVGVMDGKDGIESHIRDTMTAGAGIVDESVARFISECSCAAIQWLIQQGVAFTQDLDSPFGLHVTREGGHTQRRIFHAADATGKAIHQALLYRAQEHPNIQIMEHWVAIDVLKSRHILGQISQHNEPKGSQDRCFGIYALSKEHHEVMAILASDVVIATGGVGQAYLHTTNPISSTGDGIAMAWRAGCRVANMEFIQFHPTTFYQPRSRSLLITEALRGEGAYLTLPNGFRFMSEYDARLELAPRDIVARAIDAEIKKHQLEYVLLDASHLGEKWLKEHFPTIFERCLEEGIDISKRGIPVVPAAHYTCGGIVVSQDGQTDIAHLYAVGESTYTGFHGANRLASNSLLECVVMGQRVAQHLRNHPSNRYSYQAKLWAPVAKCSKHDLAEMSRRRDCLRHLMWNEVGIVRSQQGLEHALQEIQNMQNTIGDEFYNDQMHQEGIELRNLLICAECIVLCALLRYESRGTHYNRDRPHTLMQSTATILTPSRN